MMEEWMDGRLEDWVSYYTKQAILYYFKGKNYF
jgi:hypothetical protein